MLVLDIKKPQELTLELEACIKALGGQVEFIDSETVAVLMYLEGIVELKR